MQRRRTLYLSFDSAIKTAELDVCCWLCLNSCVRLSHKATASTAKPKTLSAHSSHSLICSHFWVCVLSGCYRGYGTTLDFLCAMLQKSSLSANLSSLLELISYVWFGKHTMFFTSRRGLFSLAAGQLNAPTHTEWLKACNLPRPSLSVLF